MSRRILTQREQWPFRCAAPDEANEGNPVQQPKPAAPASPPAPTAPKMPGLPSIPGMPKAPNPGQLGGDYNSWQQKQQGQPLDPPGHPTRGQATPGDLKNLPSLEAAGISDVDYSHLPTGAPMTGFSPGTGTGTGGGGQPGAGMPGAGHADGGAGGYGATPSAGGPAPAGGDAASWKARIQKDIAPQLQQRGITDPAAIDRAVNSIYTQGVTESGWRDVTESPSTPDSNIAQGHPSESYLQYTQPTFDRAMGLAGTPGANIHDPDAQIRGVIPLEESEGKFGPGGFTDNGSGVGYGHGWG